MPESKVRLEYRPAQAGRPHLDIWLSAEQLNVAVELKYRTRAIEVEIGSESFVLNSHGAQDQGRYDFLKDIVRLERVVAELPHTSGVALMITNDSALWTSSARANLADEAFRLDEAKGVTGNLAWGATTGPTTMKGRESALVITGNHRLSWRAYSQLPVSRYGEFRYLLVMIEPSRATPPI
jgi:hypothetical protein